MSLGAILNINFLCDIEFIEVFKVMSDSDLYNSFELKRDSYDSFARTVSDLISRLLGADGITMHSVSHRCKTLNSFKVKIAKKSCYEELEQITDLAGIRLITHYEDDVDKVAKIIESEFVVDLENSIDKRQSLDPDRFGYLSLHYVISMKPERTELKEYRSFAGLKAEVQVRSILQHTWAEIEHDTGYKTSVEVPRHIRRRFSRLAGLLELADQEFIGIRTALDEYSAIVAVKIVEQPDESDVGLDVLIDKISLEKFILLEPLVKEIDREVCQILNADTGSDLSQALHDVFRLKLVGVESLADLKRALKDNRHLIIARAKSVSKMEEFSKFKGSKKLELRFAISVLYLLQVLAARSGDMESIRSKLNKMGFKGSSMAAVLKAIVDEAGE